MNTVFKVVSIRESRRYGKYVSLVVFREICHQGRIGGIFDSDLHGPILVPTLVS